MKPCKQWRLFEVIAWLRRNRGTMTDIQNEFNLSSRTIYRYLISIDELGFPIEQDFEDKYFIIECECPFCGNVKINSNGTTE